MSRIDRSSRRPGPFTGLLLRLARRRVRAITGRAPEGMIGPLEAYALRPRLLVGYGALEDATARSHAMPERLKQLAELKAATMTSCEYCIDIGSQIARRSGIGDRALLDLPRYRDSDQFDEVEKLVLDYAVGMSRTPVAVSDELFARLREHFDDAQLVELTHIIALENLRGRFNLALGFGAAGFSEGSVCAVPAAAADVRADEAVAGDPERNGASAQRVVA